MVKIDLSCQDICAIIKSCAENRVTSMQLGDFNLSFGPAQAQVKPGAEISEETHNQTNETSIVQQEVEVREDQLAHALVEDPVLAEKLILDGELEDDSDDNGTDE